MDNMACNKVQSVVRKVKKQVKDELDCFKQAEKKKRCLEKALATSAAICFELEKKKQKKKKGLMKRVLQLWLFLCMSYLVKILMIHVRLCQTRKRRFSPWDCAGNIDLFIGGRRVHLPHQNHANCAVEGFGWVSDAYGSGCEWGEVGNSDSRIHAQHFEDEEWDNMGFSAGAYCCSGCLIPRIFEDDVGDTVVFNKMLRG